MKTLLLAKRYNRIITWSVVFMLLFVFLQIMAQYHFFYMEQWQTFFYESSFIKGVLLQPGGFAFLSADFLIQFFCIPYCGALLLALVLLIIAFFTGKIIDNIIPNLHISYLGIIPTISLLFIQITNVNYHMAGTIAFMFMILALYYYTRIKSLKAQIVYCIILSVALFILAGPIATLFSINVLLFGLFRTTRRSYYFILPILLVCMMAQISAHLGFSGDYINFILQDYYFNQSGNAPSFAYQSWIILIIIFTICLLFRNNKSLNSKTFKTIQILQIILIFVFGCSTYKLVYRPKDETFKQFTYYLRMHKWDNIIQLSNNVEMSNYLYQICLNMALAEKGELAEHLLDYQQGGLASIYLSDQISSPNVAMIVSDEYLSMGCIAMSQRWAFEANESMDNNSAYAFERLAQTNIIFEAYKVADKYLSILDNTLFYKNWAESQRKFLYNDKAVEKDSFLGLKRKCIFPENCFGGQYGIDNDLKHIIDYNPGHKATIQYLGSMYILINDIDKFNSMIKRYYGTKALPSLPKSFKLVVDKYSLHKKDCSNN